MSVLFASADRAAATYTQEFFLGPRKKGILVTVNDTAGSGTVDVKLQRWDETEQAWDDITGANLVQITGAIETDLTLYPGAVVTANRSLNTAVPDRLRCVAIVGTANATFSVAVIRLA